VPVSLGSGLRLATNLYLNGEAGWGYGVLIEVVPVLLGFGVRLALNLHPSGNASFDWLMMKRFLTNCVL
jgi:hypothetical protein